MLLSEPVSEFVTHNIHGNERVERRVPVSERDVPSVPECVLKSVPEVDSVGVWQYPISLICMSAHKASAARWHVGHQATSGQPAIWALPQSPLRGLTLSVLLT